MCIFQSGKDIPTVVRISLRTIQYLVIPLMSIAILVVGSMHLGKCDAQHLLPVWHIVAGTSGMLVPIFYLLFDEINPWLSRKLPAVSEFLDNIVVFILPIYILFEISWLITGTVWIAGSEDIEKPDSCDHTVYVFSLVVIVNFWIHILTPLIFMLALCCTRIFPYCAYCGYWNIMKTAIEKWTRQVRLGITFAIAWPLSFAMIIVGALSVSECQKSSNTTDFNQDETTQKSSSPNINNIPTSPTKSPDTSTPSTLNSSTPEEVLIPVWLIVAGSMVLFVPLIYFIYDKYCKDEGGGPLIKNMANCLVIFYLLCGLIWAVVGFVWVFGSHGSLTCGASSLTYQFAFGTLIILNCIMDIWICFKICVVLHWAFLSED